MPKFKTNDKVRIKKDYSPFWFPPLQNHYINRDVAIIIDGRDRKPLFQFKNDEQVYELYEHCLEKVSNAEDFILNKE